MSKENGESRGAKPRQSQEKESREVLTRNIISQPHSESILTANVLTPAMLSAGYYLKEDDHNIFVHNSNTGNKPLAIFSCMTTSDKVRTVIDDLMSEVR